MKFNEAYKFMKEGKKIKLPEWEGYWAWENDTITIHLANGSVLDIRETNDVDYTFNFICREDWSVIGEEQEDIYDMNAYYLYHNGYRYQIGRIEKINDKTIRMSGCSKINKESFESETYKLNDKELSMYRYELIKKLSNSEDRCTQFVSVLYKLKNLLAYEQFIVLNTEKLQENINEINDIISLELPKAIEIKNKRLTLDRYTDNLKVGSECK